MKINYFIFFFSLLSFNDVLTCQNIYKYTVSEGPEDFVLDTFSATPGLIVSCHDRWDKLQKKISYFYSITVNSKQAKK